MVSAAGQTELRLHVCGSFWNEVNSLRMNGLLLGEKKWDAVISFESFHHFLPEPKKKLYEKIFRSLKDGAVFLLGDYIACCEEEEKLCAEACLEKRTRFGIQKDVL